MKYNEFRHTDALEYADAFRACTGLTAPAIEKKAQELEGRMREIEATGKAIPSYLLAAYRGYEDAIVFRLNPAAFTSEPYIVKLDQSA